jgi:hypothetical protein
MLHNPDRHEALNFTSWNEAAARATIAEIVADTDAHFDNERFWSNHPLEERQVVLKGLWYGAAGVIWTLRLLTERGAASTRLDLADAIDRVLRKFRAEEDPKIYSGSFLMGEVGILLVHLQVTGNRALADRLFALMEADAEQPTDELMWSAPGMALAASFMWDATQDERWRTVLLRKFDELWSRWKYLPELGCHLWRQRLYQTGTADLSRPGSRLLGQRLRPDACGFDDNRRAARRDV